MEILPLCVLFDRDIDHARGFCTLLRVITCRWISRVSAAALWQLVSGTTSSGDSLHHCDTDFLNVEKPAIEIEAPRVPEQCTALLYPGIGPHEQKADLFLGECETERNVPVVGKALTVK